MYNPSLFLPCNNNNSAQNFLDPLGYLSHKLSDLL